MPDVVAEVLWVLIVAGMLAVGFVAGVVWESQRHRGSHPAARPSWDAPCGECGHYLAQHRGDPEGACTVPECRCHGWTPRAG